MKKFIKKYWHVCLAFLLFGIAVFLNGFMDHINFRFPKDSGFWSIHTTDEIDAWHISKKIMWAIIIIGFIGVKKVCSKIGRFVFVVYALINYIVHEYVLHRLFKKKRKVKKL